MKAELYSRKELQRRTTSLEIDLKQATLPQTERTVEETKMKPYSKSKKCDVCRKEFLRNCDLEHHLEEHIKTKQFQCNVCKKEFFLEWRLEKHSQSHNEATKFCHYFNNENSVPMKLLDVCSNMQNLEGVDNLFARIIFVSLNTKQMNMRMRLLKI